MYATRASLYIKMKKPNAAIRDSDAASKINPDYAKGYQSCGVASAMLGRWEEAFKDLQLALQLDCGEKLIAVLKKIEPNAKIEREKRRRAEAQAKKQEQSSDSSSSRRAEGMPGGFPGADQVDQAAYETAKKQEQSSSSRRSGGMPGGFHGGMPDLIMNDPGLTAAFRDPEVMAAF
ncbi:hypothetical protein RHSIM_Rhsim07G0048400 [Rhododendron simsii]|uniref:Uncharacterized protein n=1 Tax=Rhododendron simsii TaxID=118357 RepID=A0A834GPI3_RHOSS|nr:hypothetical protein RHSIM_Rhsim07G0048400 [Rhododendron simsii]